MTNVKEGTLVITIAPDDHSGVVPGAVIFDEARVKGVPGQPIKYLSGHTVPDAASGEFPGHLSLALDGPKSGDVINVFMKNGSDTLTITRNNKDMDIVDPKLQARLKDAWDKAVAHKPGEPAVITADESRRLAKLVLEAADEAAASTHVGKKPAALNRGPN